MATKTQQKPEAPRGLSGNMDEIFLGNVLDITVVRRLVRYSMAYRGTTIAVVFGMLGYISAVVAQPLIVAWGIDGFITDGPDE
ncbi:MAG: hypothetical protein O2826_02345, partial [Chloroflexi bacterium]|nr:hypothetical protein [Chloroflexota bacterium]